MSRTTTCTLALCAVMLIAAESGRAAPIVEFTVPAANLTGITSGPDGKLWVTEYGYGKIGTMTTSGTFTDYVSPSGFDPRAITAGPDGNLWFTDPTYNQVSKVTTSGAFTTYGTPTTGARPFDITTGPDGNLWFTEYGAYRIGTVTTGGAFMEFVIPTAGSQPEGIVAGPDGNLWFVEYSYFGNQIGRVTTGGTFTEFVIPTVGSFPTEIAVGADGNLWFTESAVDQIGRITPSGVFTEFPIPIGGGPNAITAGPDGNLWFTESGNRIGRITTTGVITEYDVPTPNSEPIDITTGPDGNIWFTEHLTGKIGRLDPLDPPPPALPPTPTATPTVSPTPATTPTTTATGPTATASASSGGPTATPTPIPVLDHFTCYQATTASGTTKFAGIPVPPGVSVADEFRSSVVAVKKPTRLCAPTQKNLEPPPANPQEHLKAYQVKPTTKFAKVANKVVSDQFGTLHVDVLKPAEIMLPTAKSLVAPPPALVAPVTDHFQCYKVKNLNIPAKFQPVTVTLADQFGSLQVQVKKPTRLCAPIDKNGEDPTASGHTGHLVCYQVKDLKQPKFSPVTPIFVNDQFGPETLVAKKPAELCVPAINGQPPTPTPSPTPTPGPVCCEFSAPNPEMCSQGPAATEEDCVNTGGVVGAPGDVCNASTGNCDPPPPSPGNCCSFGLCVAGPDVTSGFCSVQFGGTFTSNANCQPDGTCG